MLNISYHQIHAYAAICISKVLVLTLIDRFIYDLNGKTASSDLSSVGRAEDCSWKNPTGDP